MWFDPKKTNATPPPIATFATTATNIDQGKVPPPANVANFAKNSDKQEKDSQVSQVSQGVDDQKNDSQGESVATVAIVATGTESKNRELIVTVWTPAGKAMQVQARDAEHAAFLVWANPRPTNHRRDDERPNHETITRIKGRPSL